MHFIFDAFGTLFRVRADDLNVGNPPLDNTGLILETFRRRLLELTWVTRLSGTFIPFNELVKSAAAYALSTHGIRDQNRQQTLEGIYGNPLPFNDVGEVFQEVRKRGAKLYILSNGTGKMLEQAVKQCSWEGNFSGIFSVEQVRSYKPDPKIYQQACAFFGLQMEDAFFVSSNDWDVFGASSAGLKAVWLNRGRTGAYAYPGPGPFRIIKNMHAIVEFC